MYEARLAELGLVLPEPLEPPAHFLLGVQVDNLYFLSGTMPFWNGELAYRGKVPTQISVEDARQAAKLCSLHVLANLKAHLGTLDRVKRIVRLTGYVNSVPEFESQYEVINGASEVLMAVFGKNGHHARTSLGVASLSYQTPVEIDVVAEIYP